MDKNVLVTGGAGFIGSHVAEHLLKEGAVVTIIDNLASGQLRNIERVIKQLEFIHCDINDTNEVARIMKGVDIVFHLAAMPSVQRSIHEPADFHRANIDGTFSILLAARRAGVRRIVYSGSSSAYGDTTVALKREDMPPSPKSPYAVQKLTGELYTLQFDTHFGVEGVVLRYFNIFGPRQDPTSTYSGVIPLFIKRIKYGEQPRINGDGTTTRDFTYVENAVWMTVKAAKVAEARGKIFNVACGTSFTLNQLVAAINAAFGTCIGPTYGPEREGDIRASRADISRARRILGYEPVVTFEEGIKRTVASFAW